MIKKARYFKRTNKVQFQVQNERRWHYKVGEFQVWVDEHGKFACDCIWGSLHVGGLCSHVLAVCMNLSVGDEKK